MSSENRRLFTGANLVVRLALRSISSTFFSQLSLVFVELRVQGFPIRDCARGCINRDYMWLQLRAIDLKAKTFFYGLYLVVGLRKIAPRVNSPYAPTTPTIHCTTISRFLAPQSFCHHDSPSNMAESRYPRTLERLLKIRA